MLVQPRGVVDMDDIGRSNVNLSCFSVQQKNPPRKTGGPSASDYASASVNATAFSSKCESKVQSQIL